MLKRDLCIRARWHITPGVADLIALDSEASGSRCDLSGKSHRARRAAATGRGLGFSLRFQMIQDLEI